jgi:hypothetical protein
MKILSLAALTVSLIVATGCAASRDSDESEGSPLATAEGESPRQNPCESVQVDGEADVKSCVKAAARRGSWW